MGTGLPGERRGDVGVSSHDSIDFAPRADGIGNSGGGDVRRMRLGLVV